MINGINPSKLFFHLEIDKDTRLFIRLEERSPTPPYPKISSRVLYLDTVKGLSTSRDQAAIAHLVALHLKAPRSPGSLDCLSFNRIDIPPSHLFDTLQQLAKTDRLLFQGKILQAHLTSPTLLVWEGEESESGLHVTPFFYPSNEKRPLETADRFLFGKPTLWMADGHLGSFSPNISRNWIERFAKGPQFLQGRDRREFLEMEYPLHLKAKANALPVELVPELHLTDATGSFATLQIHYRGVGTIAYSDPAPKIAQQGRCKGQECALEKELLETHFITKQVGRSTYYCPGEHVYESLKLLLDVGWTILDPQRRRLRSHTAPSINLHTVQGEAHVQALLSFQEKQIPLQNLWPLRSAQKRWIPLDAGSAGLIDWKQINPLSSLLDQGEPLSETVRFAKETLSLLLPLLDTPETNWDPTLRAAATALKEKGALEEAPPAPSFQGTLLPYQQAGVNWLSFLYQWGLGGLLADEMGLGKTVQVVAFLSRLPPHVPILVIAPASLLIQWQREIQRFLPSLKDITIISYAKLRLDIDTLALNQWEILILDESQMIKTRSTQTAAAAARIQSRFRLALSGTPMENRPEELLSQFSILLPRLLEKLSLTPIENKKAFAPFLLRRTKASVALELPPKIDQISWIEMTQEQTNYYQSFASHFRAHLIQQIGPNGSLHRMEILEAILRLRQIACDPRLFQGKIPGAKIEQLFLDLEEAREAGRKILIYSQFTSFLKLIQIECQEKGWPFLTLDGSTPLSERAERVEQFQQGQEAPSLFFLSLKAGGVGLNLTAADTIFLLDPWWNSSVEEQAIARSHRIGQTQTLFIKRYLTPSSIEEKMLALKEAKEQKTQELLDPESSWTAEDLVHLLS